MPMPLNDAIKLLRDLPYGSRGIVDEKIPVDRFEQLSQQQRRVHAKERIH
jgi:hypothetical protein